SRTKPRSCSARKRRPRAMATSTCSASRTRRPCRSSSNSKTDVARVFIGHFGAGFAAKRAAPRVSLGWLLVAAQFLDLLWPTLLLFGVERVAIVPGATAVTPLEFVHYPVSHSLAAVAGWALLLGGGYWALNRGGRAVGRAAAVLAALVVSHWLLDALVHAPDLPLTPVGDARIGLGLWQSPI